jgi:hypothetical protein
VRPTAEQLFETYFLPLYPEDARADLAAARTTDANPASNPTVLAHLDDAASVFVQGATRLFGRDLALDYSDASVHRLGHAMTEEARERWTQTGTPGTGENELFNAVVHGAAYVGACIVRNHDARWAVRRPLWESLVVLRSAAGEAHLPVFHWWLKSLAEGGASLADRYRTHVEVPRTDKASMPVWLPPDRRLPRIAKGVRYDVLYKHLRAHAPELRDVGKDFPSPERFAELELAWLDFAMLGEGRMLLLYGRGKAGLHMFWLDAGGFVKGAFFPCDRFPEPVVRLQNDTMDVVVSVGGEARAHSMMWFGP